MCYRDPRFRRDLTPGRQPIRTGGFALPAVLIVMVVLTAVIAPTLMVVQQELAVSDAVARNAEDENASENAIVDLLDSWDDAFYQLAVWGSTLVRRPTLDGADTVGVRVTRTSDQLYLLEVLGGDAAVTSALTVRASAERVVPQAALEVGGSAELQTNAYLRAWDAAPVGWSCSTPLVNLPGVLATDASKVTMGPGSSIYGTPPSIYDPDLDADAVAEELGNVTFTQLASYADVVLQTDLPALSAPATKAGACDTTSTTNWGDPMAPMGACADYFPIIHAQGNLMLPAGTRGQGILLVDGSLGIENDVVFYGIIVARNNIKMGGSGIKLWGAVFARGSVVLAPTAADGPQIQYSSCVIEAVQAGNPNLGSGVHPIESRSWVEVAGS